MVRIFVGCAPNHEDAESQSVFEWSLRKHASLPVEITWMKLRKSGPFSGWQTYAWATPFTGFRWVVPALCNYEGKAIYCDSDFMFLADIAELWNQSPPHGKVLLARSATRMCISMWDCKAARSHVPSLEELRGDPDIHAKMRKYFHQHSNLIEPFVGNWNCLDGEDEDDLSKIKAVHYTGMRNQFHLKYATERLAKVGRKHWFDGEFKPHWRKDLQSMFDQLLQEAARSGYPVSKYTQDEIYGDFKKKSVANIGKPGWTRKDVG